MRTQVENKYNLVVNRDFGLIEQGYNKLMTGNLGCYTIYDVEDYSLLIENSEFCKFFLSVRTPDFPAYEYMKTTGNSFPELISDCNTEKIFIYHANILIDWFINEYVNR